MIYNKESLCNISSLEFMGITKLETFLSVKKEMREKISCMGLSVTLKGIVFCTSAH